MYTACYSHKPEMKVQTEDAYKKRPFDRSKGVENAYATSLLSVTKVVNKLLGDFNPNAPKSIDKMLKTLKIYSVELHDWAVRNAGKVIYSLNNQDKRMWQKNAKIIAKGMRFEIENAPIDILMAEYLKANVGLIKSMPLQAEERIQKLMLENLQSGEHRATGLAEEIQKIHNMGKNRAMLIARTETARISTGLTKARSKELDLEFYVWRTSRDARVRNPHRIMDNMIISWNNPVSPEALAGEKKNYGPYHPGETFNCRCYPQPLISLSDISFPAKVYHSGRIEKMTKSVFLNTFGQKGLAHATNLLAVG